MTVYNNYKLIDARSREVVAVVIAVSQTAAEDYAKVHFPSLRLSASYEPTVEEELKRKLEVPITATSRARWKRSKRSR